MIGAMSPEPRSSDTSWAVNPGVRRSMLSNRRRDTAPELAVRRMLHASGLRYRVDFAPTANKRRRADIVFTRRRLAIYIDGCFWHSCPLHRTSPRANSDYWEPKLRRNVERDRETTAALAAAGWSVFRFWEHEPPELVVATVIAALRDQVPEHSAGVDALSIAAIRITARSDPHTPGAAAST
ncbi:very short patch repair endonuclease [Microcella flavibacter]|uniref:very short patch repair endonuclease n=1 Tax=Microcella flavibacter TaxID=1804990 RepID=UPI002B279877|nr:very short patch repair endonuclease [Microcella flavibacter]